MKKKQTKKKLGAVAIKHKRVIEKMSENIQNGGKKTAKEIKKECGYSDSYAESSHMSETKTWDEVAEDYFPSDKVASHIDQLLTACEIQHYVFPGGEKDEDIRKTIEDFGFKVMKISKQGEYKRAYFAIMNAQAKKGALEMICKLKKLYTDGTVVNVNSFKGKSKEDLVEIILGGLGFKSESNPGDSKTGKE